MSNPIEEADRRQQRYWRRLLLALLLFFALLVVRHLFGTVFKEHEGAHAIRLTALIVKLALLLVMVTHLVKLGRLQAAAAANPELKEALIDNELVRLHLAQSWKAGFIGAAVTPFVFLLISSFHPIYDPVSVAFTTPSVGSVAFLVSFYLKSNR